MFLTLAASACTAIAAIERWRPVPGYEGIYEVSSCGRVRSVDRIGVKGDRLRGKILRPGHSGAMGHAKVVLYDARGGRRTRTVHILVAAAFLGDRPDGLVVDHIDGDPKNNRAGNLRYTTQAQNCRNRHRGKRGVSGVVGVYRNGRGWKAVAKDSGRQFSLGTYASIGEAAAARADFEERTNYRDLATCG